MVDGARLQHRRERPVRRPAQRPLLPATALRGRTHPRGLADLIRARRAGLLDDVGPVRPRAKYEHCLADLLHRARVGDLPIEIVLVVSNHPDAGYLATAFDVDFLHLPVDRDNKAAQERKMLGEARPGGRLRRSRALHAILTVPAPPCPDRSSTSTTPTCQASREPSRTSRHARGVKIIGATASARPRRGTDHRAGHRTRRPPPAGTRSRRAQHRDPGAGARRALPGGTPHPADGTRTVVFR